MQLKRITTQKPDTLSFKMGKLVRNKLVTTSTALKKRRGWTPKIADPDVVNIGLFIKNPRYRNFIISGWVPFFLGFTIFFSTIWIWCFFIDGNPVSSLLFLAHSLNECSTWDDLGLFPIKLFASAGWFISTTEQLNMLLTESFKTLSLVDAYICTSPVASPSVIFGDKLNPGFWGDFTNSFMPYAIGVWLYADGASASKLFAVYAFLSDLAESRRMHFCFSNFGDEFWYFLIFAEIQPILDWLFDHYRSSAELWISEPDDGLVF